MKSTILIAILIIVATAGCVGGKNSEDVFGTYENKHKPGKYLDINPDGTFREYTYISDGRRFSGNKGTYELKRNKITFFSSVSGLATEGKINGDEINIKQKTPMGLYREDWKKRE